MKVLIKTKLSPHKSKTPEGYLICQDAIIARTGPQDYLKSEIYPGFDGEDEMISVNRRAEEVFAPATLASFENKPLTCEHPDENVTPENYRDLAVGFVRDVRRGKSEDGEDVMLANLVVTDAEIIDDIEHKIRTDLSCGYDCDITDGKYPEQINIRGNHVALCEQGRAGIARIIDSAEESVEDTDEAKDEDKPKIINTFEEGEAKVLIPRTLYHNNMEYWPHKNEEWVDVIEETEKAYHVKGLHTATDEHPEIKKDFWVAKQLVEGIKKLKKSGAEKEARSEEIEKEKDKEELKENRPEALEDELDFDDLELKDNLDVLKIAKEIVKADDYIDEEDAIVFEFDNKDITPFKESILGECGKEQVYERPEATYVKLGKECIYNRYTKSKKEKYEADKKIGGRHKFNNYILNELKKIYGNGIEEALMDYVVELDGDVNRTTLYTNDKEWARFLRWVKPNEEYYHLHNVPTAEEFAEHGEENTEILKTFRKYLGIDDSASNRYYKKSIDIMKEKLAGLTMQHDSEDGDPELSNEIRNAKANLISTIEEQIDEYEDKVKANTIMEEANDKNFKAGKNAKIRQWYAIQYPDEIDIVKDMNPDCTFEDLWNVLNKREDVDKLLNIRSNDPEARMKIFGELADMIPNKDLDYVVKRYQLTHK